MKNKIKAQWSDIIAYLMEESDISKPAIRTFIEPLEVYSYKDGVVTLQIDKETQGDCIGLLKSRYNIHIKVAIEVVIGEEVEISYIYKSEAVPTYIKEETLTDKYPYLKSGHSFDTFVTSQSNSMAHAAAVAVAEAPTSQVYNPLFLYSGPGLGKTHLMHSIARHIIEHYPELNVLYTTSEDFTNQVIEAIRTNKKKGDTAATTNLRKKYRNVDVLLIDDIQFIIGKESTQEEFFHTFNALHSAKKQIIISSDKPPKDMEILEDRIRSRFEWGLLADISSPDYETRVAILRKKEEMDGYNLDDAIIEYIAKNIKSNIRELEGSLNKIIAYAHLEKREITMELAETVLQDIISPNEKKIITPEYIVNTVAEHFDITPEDIAGSKRNSKIVYPRQIAMYLCRELTNIPLKSIGKCLGNRDHTTIMHGCEKIEQELQTTPSTQKTIDILKKKLQPGN